MKLLGRLLLIFCVLLSFQSFAQDPDCGCDHKIDFSMRNEIDGEELGVKPGDKVCLMANPEDRTYRNLRMINFIGTAEQPILITNCGGRVVVGRQDFHFGINFQRFQHVKISGAGDENFKYGILVDGVKNKASGFTISNQSSDFEVEFVEVTDVGAGMHMVQKPRCDPQTQRGAFVQKNVRIHDNFIHDVRTEGFYFGYSFYNGSDIECDGRTVRVFPVDIKNMEFYNNRIVNTGWDGFQISCVVEGAKIYGNYVRNYGTEGRTGQSAGIVIGGGTGNNCLVYNNWVQDGINEDPSIKDAEGGIHIFGLGDIKLFNNIIIDTGLSGILLGGKTPTPGKYVHIINNTIIRPAEFGVRINNITWEGNKFYNNIIVAPGQYNVYTKKKERSFIGPTIEDYDTTNNLFTTKIESVGFQNPDGNKYLLDENSPAAKTGRDVTDLGITFDHLFQKRGIESGIFSKGAIEFGSEVITGIDDLLFTEDTEKHIGMSVYPNPYTEGELHIAINVDKQENASLELFNLSGKLLKEIFKDERLTTGQNDFVINLDRYLHHDETEKYVLLYLKIGEKIMTRKLFVNSGL